MHASNLEAVLDCEVEAPSRLVFNIAFFGPVRMTGKTLSVHEVQDKRLIVAAAPVPSGQVVGIEKPVPVAAASVPLLHTPAAVQLL